MFRLFISIFALLILLFPKVSYAVFNNISGTYSGTINFTDTNGTPGPCPNPGNFTGTLTITLVGDDTGNITGGSGQFINNSDASSDLISSVLGSNDDTNFTISFLASRGVENVVVANNSAGMILIAFISSSINHVLLGAAFANSRINRRTSQKRKSSKKF